MNVIFGFIHLSPEAKRCFQAVPRSGAVTHQRSGADALQEIKTLLLFSQQKPALFS